MTKIVIFDKNSPRATLVNFLLSKETEFNIIDRHDVDDAIGVIGDSLDLLVIEELTAKDTKKLVDYLNQMEIKPQVVVRSYTEFDTASLGYKGKVDYFNPGKPNKEQAAKYFLPYIRDLLR